MFPTVNLIVATCNDFGIGFKGTVPWKLKKEMAYFSRITKTTRDPNKQNVVLMGRKTWLSIPEEFRPLSNRINIVHSRDKSEIFPGVHGAHVCNSIDDAINLLTTGSLSEKVEMVWVIGGSSVYESVMKSAFCHRIYLTRIFANFECDTFFPEFNEEKFKLVTDDTIPQDIQEENTTRFKYEVYEKIH